MVPSTGSAERQRDNIGKTLTRRRLVLRVVNASKIFGLKSFTIISQEFHNERAIYQAEHLGLDIENIQAYNAKMPKSRRAYLTSIREYFARVKMFIDLLTT